MARNTLATWRARNGTGKARVFTLMATNMRVAGGRIACLARACTRGRTVVSTRAVVQGNKSAEGLMTWANGQTYKGKWRTPDCVSNSDEFIFFDEIVNDDAEILYECRDGGEGLYMARWKKNSKQKFSYGMKYGNGEMTWPNGDKLTSAEWNEDCIIKGTYIWHDGKLPDVHTDWFNNGIYNGFWFRDGLDDPVCDCDKVSSFWCYRKELGHHRESTKVNGTQVIGLVREK